MKKLVLMLLVVCLTVCTVAPAYAAEIEAGDEQEWIPPDESEETVAVSTLDELLEAIANAKGGDAIMVSEGIVVDSDCEIGMIGKKVTLIPQAGLKSPMLWLTGGTVDIISLDFDGGIDSYSQTVISCSDTTVNIQNCAFRNCTGAIALGIQCACNIYDSSFVGNYTPLSNGYNSAIHVENCCFSENTGITACIMLSGNISFVKCDFTGNYAIGGDGGVFMLLSGAAEFSDCRFSENITYNGKGAAIYTGGKTTISNCVFLNNRSGIAGNDLAVFGGGSFSILDTDEELEKAYALIGLQYDGIFVDEVDNRYAEGDTPLKLPLVSYAVDFTFGVHEKTDVPPTDVDEGVSVPPISGEDREEEENDDEIQNQDGQTPPAEDADAVQIPQEPQETEEPEDDTMSEDNSNAEAPQKPSEGHDKDDDDYTPAPSYKPVINPTEPTEAEPEKEELKPTLSCGSAVIDYSRSAVLHGYGNGLFGEDDPLTRAQMATIIFRLLDDESVAALSPSNRFFADVDSDAWYAPYILALADAGAVAGTGGDCFSPNGAATWAQVLTVLTRFAGVQEYELQHIRYEGWARQAIETSVSLDWIEDSAEFDPGAVITRGEAVNLLNRVLEQYRYAS